MKIHFIGSSNPKSRSAYRYMVKRYGQYSPEEADCIVVLSGDGMILRTFHEKYRYNLPIYGMNRGIFGFLANAYQKDDLIERIQQAKPLKIHPLRADVTDGQGRSFSSIAINEVYLLRETHQTAKIQIKINNEIMMAELVGDGLIAASDIGSTAYNYSAGGPIIPPGSPLLALTPISPFRPRGWRGALLPEDVTIELTVINNAKRPVCAVADYEEYRDAVNVKIQKDKKTALTLLIDPDCNLYYKSMKEQFAT